MEKSFQVPTREEWQLGGDTDTELTLPEVPRPARPPAESGYERLERPLQVVTVEHLAWIAIGGWTLLTRLSALGDRPLTPAEARHALVAFDLINRTSEASAAGFHSSWSGWLDLLTAGIFALCGASDIAARAIFVVCGIVLVALAFILRPYLGRAGAIGAAAMLALSPSITWFSRSATSGLAAVTLAVSAVALFMTMKARPSARCAGALGVAGGLMVSASPIGLIIATIFVTAMVIIGLFAILMTKNRWLQVRVWFTRYGSMSATAILTAIAVCIFSSLVAGSSIAGIDRVMAAFMPLRASNFRTALNTIILPLSFYEFMILLGAGAGFVTVLTARARSGFAFFMTLWVILSASFYLMTPAHTPEQILMVVVPAALLAGVAIEYLNRTRLWPPARWVIGALGLLTIYLQLLTNFVYCAPDPNDAPWARHANLYWGEGATTPQTATQCAAVLKQIAPASPTVYHAGEWPPALRWYLREARPVELTAAAIVVATDPGGRANAGGGRQFDYEETWIPSPAGLDTTRAVRYFFSQRTWGEVTTRIASIQANPRIGAAAPSVTAPPSRP
ncbi:MAG TPA: hypothetical protein VKS22_15970 [Candidatus Binataceae bacterium]|nr:hypothetical protein [Candidatus Binataceae bacterium]